MLTCFGFLTSQKVEDISDVHSGWVRVHGVLRLRDHQAGLIQTNGWLPNVKALSRYFNLLFFKTVVCLRVMRVCFYDSVFVAVYPRQIEFVCDM